jgi:hypothetical protein
MATWRQAREVVITDEEVARLTTLSRSQTGPLSRVQRAQTLLAYRDNPSFFAVGQRVGVHHQTVQRCIERALASFHAPRRNPELPRSPDGIDGLSTPAGGLVAEAMIVSVMGSAQRHCEFVADIAMASSTALGRRFCFAFIRSAGSRPRAFATSR